MGDFDCGGCGAKREIGHVICKFCKNPYAPDALASAIACPRCPMLSAGDQQKCIACGTWIVVQCVFCGATSAHTMTTCSQCGEIFLGAADRKARGEYANAGVAGDEDDDDGWERHWAWCEDCQSLVYDADPGGACAAGGEHDTDESDEYTLNCGDGDVEGESGWMWCRACECLFYGGNQGGRCVATGGPHDATEGGDYTMSKDATASDGEGWMWCGKCDVMFYAGEESGTCAAGGEHEAGSEDYYAVAGAEE